MGGRISFASPMISGEMFAPDVTLVSSADETAFAVLIAARRFAHQHDARARHTIREHKIARAFLEVTMLVSRHRRTQFL